MRGCLKAAIAVTAVNSMYCGEWRECAVDCADARERRERDERAKVCGVEWGVEARIAGLQDFSIGSKSGTWGAGRRAPPQGHMQGLGI